MSLAVAQIRSTSAGEEPLSSSASQVAARLGQQREPQDSNLPSLLLLL